jgi:hypothetical protein
MIQIGINIAIKGKITISEVPPPPEHGDSLLTEDGFYLLLEDNSHLLLE